jgi:hypothetical protein
MRRGDTWYAWLVLIAGVGCSLLDTRKLWVGGPEQANFKRH